MVLAPFLFMCMLVAQLDMSIKIVRNCSFGGELTVLDILTLKLDSERISGARDNGQKCGCSV